eukprot:358727-Chlamydomonas_euryale.AAC.1
MGSGGTAAAAADGGAPMPLADIPLKAADGTELKAGQLWTDRPVVMVILRRPGCILWWVVAQRMRHVHVGGMLILAPWLHPSTWLHALTWPHTSTWLKASTSPQARRGCMLTPWPHRYPGRTPRLGEARCMDDAGNVVGAPEHSQY